MYLTKVTLFSIKSLLPNMFPEENRSFESNIVLVDKVDDDREASLRELRKAMLSREDLEAAVFIGGMDGVEVEYSLFHQYHPQKIVLPVVATGGAAQKLGKEYTTRQETITLALMILILLSYFVRA